MQTVSLESIVFDAGTQVRAAINEDVVTSYAERMEAGDSFPPIVLFHDGNNYYLGDGFHRSLAAKRNGLAELPADVRAGTKTDALWFGLGANRTNGHRLTVADKKHAILLALYAWPDKSSTQLAEHIGCAQTFVVRLRGEVSTSANLPTRVTGKDGKSYPASKADRPNRPEPKDPSRTKDGKAERLETVKRMADDGYTSRQIADSIGLTFEGFREMCRRESIEVTADKAMGKVNRHDSTRIIEQIVMDAEHLTADVNLIELSDLSQEKVGGYIDQLIESRKALDSFIRKLKEHKAHVENAA